jgi:hypothetical protein
MFNWRIAKPGEKIKMPDGVEGVVLANFELSLFDETITPGGWNDEQGGLLVSPTFGGLIRYSRLVLD